METLSFLDTIINGTQSQFAKVDSIREQLQDVIKVQLHSNMIGFENPNSFATYYENGGQPLGTVGGNFIPTQPKFLLDNFVNALVECNADLSTLTYKELKGGSKIMFTANIGTFAYKNLRGLNDEMITKLNIQTAFDGTAPTSLFLSNYRMVCANGMKSWKTEFQTSFKNTSGNVGKASMLGYDVAKAIESQKDYNEFLEVLTKREISKKEHEEFIAKVTKMKVADYNALSKRSQNIVDKLEQSIAIEMKDAGASAWALLNGVTRYNNHMVKKSANDSFEYIFSGAGEKQNDLAQKVAFEMFAN